MEIEIEIEMKSRHSGDLHSYVTIHAFCRWRSIAANCWCEIPLIRDQMWIGYDPDSVSPFQIAENAGWIQTIGLFANDWGFGRGFEEFFEAMLHEIAPPSETLCWKYWSAFRELSTHGPFIDFSHTSHISHVFTIIKTSVGFFKFSNW